MKVIIVGAGRLGRGLAARLDRRGYGVTVIDRDEKSVAGLGDRFSGQRVVGGGLDRRVLEEAGIGQADALVACTSSDEVNMVVARVARNTYRVPRVVARLYDVSKVEAYRRLGIQTVSTIDWGVRRVCELLTYHEVEALDELGTGSVRIVRADVPALLEGHAVREITVPGEIQVVALSHDNETFVPMLGTVLGHGDIVYAAVMGQASEKFAQMLGMNG